ncbi:MAG: Hpt domain-containing protein, partial [Planctomycetaceae bacterium]
GVPSPANQSLLKAPRQPELQTLRSTLPMEVPEFREIVAAFANGLRETLARLRHSQTCMDYQEIRELAHRLKGTGGTVGFADFTEPSGRLQNAAEIHDDDTIEAMISELEQIASRLEITESALI